MKFSWKNIENWRSWKMSFFWVGLFEFFFSKKNKIVSLFSNEKTLAFIRGIISFCTMDGFFRILEKRLSELICTRLYLVMINQQSHIAKSASAHIRADAHACPCCAAYSTHGNYIWHSLHKISRTVHHLLWSQDLYYNSYYSW